METSTQSPLDLARAACDTLMRAYAPDELPPRGRFHYHQGVFLSGMAQTYALCGEERYVEYVKAWVDSLVDAYGNIAGFNPGQLDDLQPGILLFSLYARTGDKRYRRALETIAHYLRMFPTNPDGGFWHKAWLRNQMWLDGLYMAGPFCAEYARAFDEPALLDSAFFQAKLMEEKLRDPQTGLWRHAWDYEKEQPWADARTGRSPEFWGRSMGWVCVALLDEIGFMPEGDPRRGELARMACDLLKALIPHQDAKTGLWYQVVDKGNEPGNWLETSCACLFAAALFKAYRTGLMGTDALRAAKRAYRGVAERLVYDERGLQLKGVCVGTGVGDYAHYCARPTGANDLHGVGAFLFMCTQAAFAPGLLL